MYRDDLEAALARNHELERQVRALQRAARPVVPEPVPPPAHPTVPTTLPVPPARPRAITYVRPARYFPAIPAFRCWLRVTLGWFGRLRPTLAVPAWWSDLTSDVLLLDLARWPLLAAWIPLAFAITLIGWIGAALYVAFVVPVMAIGTLALSVIGLPVVVALSVRRGDHAVGLRWGTQIDDTTALTFAAVVMGVWSILAPIVSALVL